MELMGIGSKLLNFAFTPIMDMSSASSTMVEQALDSDEIDKAKETAKFSALADIAMMRLFSLVAIIFPEQIMKLFVNEKAVMKIGITMIRILIPSFVLAGWAYRTRMCIYWFSTQYSIFTCKYNIHMVYSNTLPVPKH